MAVVRSTRSSGPLVPGRRPPRQRPLDPKRGVVAPNHRNPGGDETPDWEHRVSAVPALVLEVAVADPQKNAGSMAGTICWAATRRAGRVGRWRSARRGGAAADEDIRAEPGPWRVTSIRWCGRRRRVPCTETLGGAHASGGHQARPDPSTGCRNPGCSRRKARAVRRWGR
jgi:hypothetical protein